MRTLANLFANNRRWSEGIRAREPDFFARLSRQQRPHYLWIGCADSRVPANEIVGLMPGELFVHRNVANVVIHTDLNCLTVMQFAIDILKVGHVIVCGHYGCSGVQAALRGERIGLADNWLRHVQDVRRMHAQRLAVTDDAGVGGVSEVAARAADRLCELNVIEQVMHVCETTIVRDAWARGQALCVHGWIYGLHDGLLRDLGVTITQPAEAAGVYQRALSALSS